MDRKLASIQKIISVEPIENADAIECVTVLGWHCVAKKDEFKPDDLCVYCEVDSIMPHTNPEFKFLEERKYRIKTIKLRGQISQGICFPISILPPNVNILEGKDVTEILEITKYDPEKGKGNVGLFKRIKRRQRSFPTFIPKTDEVRIQSVPKVLVRKAEEVCAVTEKLDGASTTVWVKDGKFGVASRNLTVTETKGNVLLQSILTFIGEKLKIKKLLKYRNTWNGYGANNKYIATAKQLSLEEKLKNLDLNIALQGELVGPAIQDNRYNLKEYEIYWYNVYNIDTGKYLSSEAASDIVENLGLKYVPNLGKITLGEYCVDSLVKFSKGKSILNNKTQREGVVIRGSNGCTDEQLGRLSFKVINPEYLLKYE